MTSSQVNHFLSFFCKEVTFNVQHVSATCDPMAPEDVAQLISTIAQEVLDRYISCAFETHEDMVDFEKFYHELALQGVSAYEQSNEIFGQIAQEHATLMNENLQHFPDSQKIGEKMGSIHAHLNNEVDRANEVIHSLQEQVKRLEMTSTLDSLTKTYNRHALLQDSEEFLSKDKRFHDLFVILLDIDDFKTINDRFGHLAGDKILIFITKLFKKALRDGDKVYRYGGEEFFILLNRTNMDGAQLIGDRLINLCRKNKPLFQNEQISVTISLGLTQMRSDDTLDSLTHRADVALYRAKHNGKDRMEVEL